MKIWDIVYKKICLVWFQGEKWVTSKKVNIDFDKFNFENCNIEFNIDFFNIDSKTGSNRGSNRVPRGMGGGGVTADDDRGCYDPVLLSMLPFSKLNSM